MPRGSRHLPWPGQPPGLSRGGAGYLANGGVTVATGGRWQFNWGDFGASVGVGALLGAATGAAGYGAGKGLSRLAALFDDDAPVAGLRTLPRDPFDLEKSGYRIVEHDFIPDTRGGGYQVQIESPGGARGVYHSGHDIDLLRFNVRGGVIQYPDLHFQPHYQLYGPYGEVHLAPGDVIPWWFG